MSSIIQIEPTSLLLQKPKMFIICDNCYWCASAIGTRQLDIDSCPLCEKPVSSLPLADNEEYRFSNTTTRGVELIFTSRR
jgi:hypothetical protein